MVEISIYRFEHCTKMPKSWLELHLLQSIKYKYRTFNRSSNAFALDLEWFPCLHLLSKKNEAIVSSSSQSRFSCSRLWELGSNPKHLKKACFASPKKLQGWLGFRKMLKNKVSFRDDSSSSSLLDSPTISASPPPLSSSTCKENNLGMG